MNRKLKIKTDGRKPIIMFDDNNAIVLPFKSEEQLIHIKDIGRDGIELTDDFKFFAEFKNLLRIYSESATKEYISGDRFIVYVSAQEAVIYVIPEGEYATDKIKEREAGIIGKAALKAGMDQKTAEKLRRNFELRNSDYDIGSDDLYAEIKRFIKKYPAFLNKLSQTQQKEMDKTGIQPLNKIQRPTETTAISEIEKAEAWEAVHIINAAITAVPEEYRDGVINHVIYNEPYEKNRRFFTAHRNTWSNYTKRFIYQVAILKGYGPLIKMLRDIKGIRRD